MTSCRPAGVMATNVRGGGFDSSILSVGGEWIWRVTASNIRGAGQLYQVEDIRTPFGPLYMAAIPIPSEVILAMASSLSEFQQQLQPKIMSTDPSGLSVTVTENDPVLQIGISSFMNIGAYGSFMTVIASPSSPWLSIDPTSVAGIGKNQSASVRVRVDPRIMMAEDSPYVGYINLQDNANPPNLISIPINVIVLPQPVIQLSQATVALSYYLSSMSSGPIGSVDISNAGLVGSYLDFTLAKVLNQSDWLEITPVSATGIPSSGSATITFSLVTDKIPSIPDRKSVV